MQTDLSDTTRRARELARILDSAFRVPGTQFRFGLDPILGLIPGVGDAVTGGFSFYLLLLAWRVGAPPIVMLRLFANIGADMLFGAIPVLGDLLDAGYKANVRNLALLERYLVRPQETTKKSLVLVGILVTILLGVFAGVLWLTVTVIGALLRAIF